MKNHETFEKLFTEIRNYRGNFGDAVVDYVSFPPLEVLKGGKANDVLGAGIGLLVNFTSHIDNSTYEDALDGKAAVEIKEAIEHGFCTGYPGLEKAFAEAFEGEEGVRNALSNIYREYIEPHA